MHQANSPLRRIVVVGGGAAGWLTASIIAVTHKHDDNISVTLVESPDVSILGVGEGTWPTMRSTLLKIGISEETFLAQCNASFKQGTSFHNWRSDTIEHQYYHPFSLPFRYFESDVAAWWQSYAAEQDFAHAVCSQAALCDHHLAPKQRQTPAYAGIANYGYHLDANKFAALLQKHATTVLGVQHIVDHVDDVVGSSSEPIAAIVGREHGNITGDLFIDCTGFAARLIGQHYGVPLTSCSNVLANDSAIAIQAPYIDSSVDIASTTHSTAQDSGWIWDIGLPSRKGVGYVYSSAHCSEDEARALSGRFASEFMGLSSGRYILVERQQMGEILEEQGLQQSGCVSSECAVEVGAALGAKYIVTGSVSKVGTVYSVNARLLDVETSQIIKSISHDQMGNIGILLTQGMKEAAAKLLGMGTTSTPTAATTGSMRLIALESGITLHNAETGKFIQVAPTTPEVVKDMEPGNYQLLAKKNGYRDQIFEVEIFAEKDIPWDELAFPFVPTTLKNYFKDFKRGEFPLSTQTIERPPRKVN